MKLFVVSEFRKNTGLTRSEGKSGHVTTAKKVNTLQKAVTKKGISFFDEKIG